MARLICQWKTLRCNIFCFLHRSTAELNSFLHQAVPHLEISTVSEFRGRRQGLASARLAQKLEVPRQVGRASTGQETRTNVLTAALLQEEPIDALEPVLEIEVSLTGLGP